VKICSLYGVGYYYIPGTDTCIKIGGYVRYEAYHNAPGGAYPTNTTAGVFTRHTNTFAQQARFRLTTDVRTQTEYGTLRSYFAFGVNWLNQPNEGLSAATAPVGFTGNLTTSLERAFIQFAGFTIGRADTFFAFYNGAAYGLVPLQFDGSSGPGGLNVFAYTWQLGNGLSASLSAEDAFQYAQAVTDITGAQANDLQGQQVPNIVANLRVDQAWGSAQIMGALHQVGARYYSSAAGISGCPAAQSDVSGCNYPTDQWGWAVGAGLTLKMPWDAKDTLSGVIAYGEGATRYIASLQGNNFMHKQGVAVGQLSDGIFATPGVAGLNGDIELTEVWGGTVAFEHYWTPSLRTSWVFGYMNVSYNDNAKALIAANNAAGASCAGAAIGTGIKAGTVSNCNPDWSAWRLASRTMWNPVANLDVGLEIAYSKIDTAYAGFATVANANHGLQSGTYAIEDQGAWSATLRVQRSFWP
jgi:hypothetical protein